jgi:hypothetical protein
MDYANLKEDIALDLMGISYLLHYAINAYLQFKFQGYISVKTYYLIALTKRKPLGLDFIQP